MPTNNNDIISNVTNDSNTNSSHESGQSQNKSTYNRELAILESIDSTVKEILKNGGNTSQANSFHSLSGNASFRNKPRSKSNSFGSGSIRGFGESVTSEFVDAFKKSIMESLIGDDFKHEIQGVFSDLAQQIGVSVEDIPKTLGSALGKKLMDSFGDSSLGKEITSKLDTAKQKFIDKLRSSFLGETSGSHSSQSAAQDSNTANRNSTNRRSVFGESSRSDSIYDTQNIVIHAQSVVVQNSGMNNATNGNASPQDRLRDTLSNQLGDGELDNLSGDDIDNILNALSGGDREQVANILKDKNIIEDGSSGIIDDLMNAFEGCGESAGVLADVTSGAGADMAMAGAAASKAAVALGAIGIASLAVVVVLNALSPAIEGTTKLIKKSMEVADRYNISRKQQIKNETDRISADVETLVKEPFNILKQAAEEMYNVWDTNLRKINGTQGYNKDDLQSLIGSFAERLRDEGLTKVVSASSITDNLAKVLDSGLSGDVAEEFAYIATKLNAAIPTQDFFSYAGTYSSIAANAIRQGKSQSDAIAEANRQLEGFANNILYASREVAGGFTTGLKDAESLFTESVQIAQASKTGNATQISAVMTAVSAITGAIAPDLAQSMTDAIYKAATGGNSSEIVALRSLAGINASNTEFLKKLADDPQSVFVNLFSELGKRQNMSQDAYMEVAEGLSNIFGVSADAFARVDFTYLSQAIASMDTTSTALLDNLDLLKSGETTTNAEQLKMQQINEYMLDEGLSYVLDNAAARSIQEHMWDEQIANELMEATYGVELQGSALEFIEGIRNTVENLLMLGNPVGAIAKIGVGLTNLIGTAVESKAQTKDIDQILELGKVGNGNQTVKRQLTTTGTNLNLTDNLVSLLGGVSAYTTTSSKRSKMYNLLTPWNSIFTKQSGYSDFSMITANSPAISRYNWRTVGKSDAAFNTSVSGTDILGVSAIKNSTSKSSGGSSRVANNAVQKFLGTMNTYLEENSGKDVTYEDWVKTATRFGISDFSEAIKDVGLTDTSVRGQFESFQTAEGIRVKQEREQREEQFWIDNVSQLTTVNTWIESIYTKQCEFYDDFIILHEDFLAYGGKGGKFESYQKAFQDYCTSWTDYYVKHTAYRNAVGYDSSSWDKVRSAENNKSRDAVYALAAALTKNSVDLLDPTVQTNVLLAEILQVVNGILQSEMTSSDGSALVNSLSAMAIGINNVK